MPLPQSEADYKLASEALLSDAYRTIYRPNVILEATKLPTLQPLWKRAWCALRGHGGITPMPGDVFYRHDGLCKRCGSRVVT